MSSAAHFIRTNTLPSRSGFVPEILLYVANEIAPIWQASETELEMQQIAPPYWAFAWPGGQALARHILDHPALVAGRTVLDFAAGGGIAAIACAQAGALSVEAAEIDPLAVAAIALNATANDVRVRPIDGDIVGDACRWDLIVCGDVCYEAPMSARVVQWLRGLAEPAEIWVADPGRAYFPATGVTEIARYRVPTTLELEDRTERSVGIFRLAV